MQYLFCVASFNMFPAKTHFVQTFPKLPFPSTLIRLKSNRDIRGLLASKGCKSSPVGGVADSGIWLESSSSVENEK